MMRLPVPSFFFFVFWMPNGVLCVVVVVLSFNFWWAAIFFSDSSWLSSSSSSGQFPITPVRESDARNDDEQTRERRLERRGKGGEGVPKGNWEGEEI